MRKAILDTDILSEYLKGHDQNVAEHSASYLRFHSAFTLTSVTVYEVVYGLAAKGAESQLVKFSGWLDMNEEIVPTHADFRWAASVKAAAKRIELVVELPDCLIAAIAVRLGMPLITGNIGDYEAIRATGVSLELENWRLDSPGVR